MKYTPKEFNLGELKGISEKQIKVHLALYQGYVKHVNLIQDTIAAYEKTDDEGGKYAIAEMRRRLGFEFDGMRMHEYYFTQLEGGYKQADEGSALAKLGGEQYGAGGGLVSKIKEVAGTRGIGWVVIYYDKVANALHTVFVNDHELGQLAGLPIIVALDLWEHAYMVDYVPADKKMYIDAFFENFNWAVAEKRLAECV